MTTVLIIDDSSFQRTLIKKTLLSEGYSCIEAGNGRLGLEMAETDQPDIILLDLLMPDMDGFSFLKSVQEQKLDVPVIVLTSDIQDTTRSLCLELGARSFLNKPLRREEIIPAIQAILESPGETGR
ncbi:MAG: response regulator [Methanocalculus sp. MSAO_Arc1]|uniref:response regulator transcription factor n=1 Tax=Methanocalculus TaxID=71151 RepID=UPI000FF64F4C|nr:MULTISPECIES: response regulator [unclassified Methanocalculus]MCP1661402.1 twitching motility two-component system response regulator PilH [Methanocalculus sp. AMF5]RQD79708.1 MAG: response regulator [Methanocalculus sp. MSAO_Arc1]